MPDEIKQDATPVVAPAEATPVAEPAVAEPVVATPEVAVVEAPVVAPVVEVTAEDLVSQLDTIIASAIAIDTPLTDYLAEKLSNVQDELNDYIQTNS